MAARYRARMEGSSRDPDSERAPGDLVAEAERGRSPRTPMLALTGVTIAVGLVVAVILAIALTVYFLYR